MARHAALALLIPVTGPVTLANDLQRWSSNKSAFVHAKSKEVFERRTYSQRIDVWDADDKAAEVLVKVLLATGRGQYVKLKVEKFSRDSCVAIFHALWANPITDSPSALAPSSWDAQARHDAPSTGQASLPQD
jgi:ribosomal protein S10